MTVSASALLPFDAKATMVATWAAAFCSCTLPDEIGS